MSIDISTLAGFLHDQDELAWSDVVAEYGSGPSLKAAFMALVKSGCLEILPNGRLQWWGTSVQPTHFDFIALLSRLQGHGRRIKNMDSKQDSRDLEVLIGVLREITGVD